MGGAVGGEGGAGGEAGAGAGGEGGAGGIGPFVVINEVQSTGDTPDFVEFYNAGDAVADLTGWYFTDDTPNTYAFPSGTTLAPGAFLAVQQANGGMDFGLNGTDGVFFYDPSNVLMDEWDYDVHQDTGGRCPDGTGDFENGLDATLAAANACP